jgi:hypothetical protein
MVEKVIGQFIDCSPSELVIGFFLPSAIGQKVPWAISTRLSKVSILWFTVTAMRDIQETGC